ncbi:YjcQ family protein [Bacillus glycinifermentans]|nr:YjcQ family protein [Bacillus glycinifermentans]UOY89402.1 YjcQ family protein [Bacillus glycinifermentans]
MNKEKLRYAIAKEISEGNTPLTEKDFEVTEDQFDEAVNFLKREGYLIGIHYLDNRPYLYKGLN